MMLNYITLHYIIIHISKYTITKPLLSLRLQNTPQNPPQHPAHAPGVLTGSRQNNGGGGSKGEGLAPLQP